MSGPPKFIIDAAEAFAFFATMASGVRHYVAEINPVLIGGFLIAEVGIAHDDPGPPEWCGCCKSVHPPPMPEEHDYNRGAPPLPTPDKVFLNPYPKGLIDPDWN